MIRIGSEAVVGDEVASNGLAIIWAEELRRGVPELSCRALAFFVVEPIFKLGVSPS